MHTAMFVRIYSTGSTGTYSGVLQYSSITYFYCVCVLCDPLGPTGTVPLLVYQTYRFGYTTYDTSYGCTVNCTICGWSTTNEVQVAERILHNWVPGTCTVCHMIRGTVYSYVIIHICMTHDTYLGYDTSMSYHGDMTYVNYAYDVCHMSYSGLRTG